MLVIFPGYLDLSNKQDYNIGDYLYVCCCVVLRRAFEVGLINMILYMIDIYIIYED